MFDFGLMVLDVERFEAVLSPHKEWLAILALSLMKSAKSQKGGKVSHVTTLSIHFAANHEGSLVTSFLFSNSSSRIFKDGYVAEATTICCKKSDRDRRALESLSLILGHLSSFSLKAEATRAELPKR